MGFVTAASLNNEKDYCERARVLAGTPYVGTSAGANLAGPTILTTNDWNVVTSDRFDAVGLVPFNINPHYLETDPAMAASASTTSSTPTRCSASRRAPGSAWRTGWRRSADVGA